MMKINELIPQETRLERNHTGLKSRCWLARSWEGMVDDGRPEKGTGFGKWTVEGKSYRLEEGILSYRI
jgi:hypothetical protein